MNEIKLRDGTITTEQELCNNPNYLQHRKEMRTLLIVGIVLGMIVFALSGALLGLVWWLLTSGDDGDVALVLGVFGTMTGIVTTIAALLSPSPLQHVQSNRQRATDTALPAGTPADPISTAEVGKTEEEPSE